MIVVIVVLAAWRVILTLAMPWRLEHSACSYVGSRYFR